MIEKIGDLILSQKEDNLGFIFMVQKINELIDKINKMSESDKEKESKVIIGIDIVTADYKIPKGTICYGHKDKEGIVVIDKIGKYNLIEEKKTLSDKVGDVKIFPHHEVLMLEDVKESLKEFIDYCTVFGIVNEELQVKAKEVFGDRLL